MASLRIYPFLATLSLMILCVKCFQIARQSISTHRSSLSSYRPRISLAHSSVLFSSSTSSIDKSKSSISSENIAPSRLKIKHIVESASSDELLGHQVTIKGWVRTLRDQKKFSFIEVNDGSTILNLQAIAESDIPSYEKVTNITTGMTSFPCQ